MASPVDERTSTKYQEAGKSGVGAENIVNNDRRSFHHGSSGYVSLLPKSGDGESGFSSPGDYTHKPWPRTWKLVVAALFVCALFISGLLLGYYIRHMTVADKAKKPERLCLKPPRPQKGGPKHLELLHENLMYTMNGDKQAAYLRNYAAKQVYSGSESDKRLTQLLRRYFEKFGFDDVKVKNINDKYDALLSLPDVDKPNEVHMVALNGKVLFSDTTLTIPKEEDGGFKGFIDNSRSGSETETKAPQSEKSTTQGPKSTQAPADGGANASSGDDETVTSRPKNNVTSRAQGEVDGDSSKETKQGEDESSRRRRKRGSVQRNLDKEDLEDEILDLNDDSITPELIERLKKMGSEPMPIPIPDLPPFVAYSPPGEVTAGIVFVGYGGPEEYGVLQKEQMPMRGRIAIARMGNQTIREKVRQAEGHGIKGLLLYMDPEDDFITPFKGCHDSIAFWANANDDAKGDPLTPEYPAIDGMARLDIKESSVPKIPVQTVGCAFAERLLRSMSGLKAPESWVGGLNITYYAGVMQGEGNFKVKMSVHNHFTQQPVHNVIATITGVEEPDKYVVVGANRNSFGLGPFGGVFGTAGLVEMARNLGILINREKWRPKRTVILCSWGGGDYGDIGLIEHIQEFGRVLDGRVVAYINLDQPVLGNYSLRVSSSPTLHNILYNAAQRVPSPDDKQSMLYDTWLDHSTEVTPEYRPAVYDLTDPRLMALPDVFFSKLGIPATHIQYMPHTNKAFDISIISEEILRHWRYHNTVNRVSGLLMLSLVDADILQYDLTAMANKLTEKVNKWLQDNNHVSNATATALQKGCEDLVEAASAMRHFILHQADYDVPTEKRLINERLVHCENIMAKAFLHIEILRIKLSVVQKLETAGAELPQKRADYEKQLAELQQRKRSISSQRAALARQRPETREKQQKMRELLRQQQDLSKPIRSLKEEIFKIEQQQLSLEILAVTIFTKNDFSELLQSLKSSKQVLKTEL